MSKAKETSKMTLRECKQYITALMENYTQELPITIEVTHKGIKEHFELVPKNFKNRSVAINLELQKVTPEELETVSAPGLYIAHEAYQMSNASVFTNYYGLFIDPDNKRDLRFFQSEKKCLDWLKKKIKSLNG